MDKGEWEWEWEWEMGHVIRLLLITPSSSSSSSSSPPLHLWRRTSLDSNSAFSLRTSITKSKPRFSCLFSGGNNQREVCYLLILSTPTFIDCFQANELGTNQSIPIIGYSLGVSVNRMNWNDSDYIFFFLTFSAYKLEALVAD